MLKEESEIWRDVFFLCREMSDILQFNVRLKLVAKLLYYKIVQVISPACLQSFLILHDKNSTRCWKHCSISILIHIDMISSQISLRSGVREG